MSTAITRGHHPTIVILRRSLKRRSLSALAAIRSRVAVVFFIGQLL
jgi:hypothetical protein